MVQTVDLPRLSPSDFYTLLWPKACDLRVYLLAHGAPEGEPSPYEELIRRFGDKHEKGHLATLMDVTDLSSGSFEERVEKTKEAIRGEAGVIYQGAFQLDYELNGVRWLITGIPDFLIREGTSYIIRDSKIARRITPNDHPEIIYALKLYGWLFEKCIGKSPVRLEVHSGANELVSIPFTASENGVLDLFRKITSLKTVASEPYSPVGWSKCGCCSFNHQCWAKAKAEQDVAILLKVDQGLAIQFHQDNVHSVSDLIGHFNETELTNYKYPSGKTSRKVGKSAFTILSAAKALSTNQAIWLQKPDIPEFENYVMFDLEGIPPQLDELDKIYLWGMQVFGESPGEYQFGQAGFGPDGDLQGWREFLARANGIFQKLGDIPFVHWHQYEKTHIDRYLKRYGDVEGIGVRVLKNLIDLLPITQKSVVLPLPSYSLKVIEKYIGFKRSQDEYGGDWSIAKYIEATEMEDEAGRGKVMKEILLYNKEDLAATWAVLQWLRGGREKKLQMVGSVGIGRIES